jgi:hypothetical protein
MLGELAARLRRIHVPLRRPKAFPAAVEPSHTMNQNDGDGEIIGIFAPLDIKLTFRNLKMVPANQTSSTNDLVAAAIQSSMERSKNIKREVKSTLFRDEIFSFCKRESSSFGGSQDAICGALDTDFEEEVSLHVLLWAVSTEIPVN